MMEEKNFWNMYKIGDIVYPGAVAANFNMTKKAAYGLCEEMKKQGQLKNLYMIRCPACKRTANSERYYSLESIDTKIEIGCCHCDYEFIPRLGEDVMVLYEKV